MPFANAHGATIHYTVEGGGRETLVLVMGLGGHASEWGGAFVADLAADYRVVCLDNRGIGQSQTTVNTWSMQDMANDVLAVLDALALSKVHLAGTSMGGMVAQLVAAEHPARVSKLVLMSTSHGGRESIPPEARVIGVLGPQPGLSIGEQRRLGLRALTSDTFADDHAELVEQLVAERERSPTPGRVFKVQLEAIGLSDRSQIVSKIHCPTLILHGDLDPLVPVANGRMLAARIPNAQLIVLEGCGHIPHLEKPVETAKAIREFLGHG